MFCALGKIDFCRVELNRSFKNFNVNLLGGVYFISGFG